jgi:hypothetical protein
MADKLTEEQLEQLRIAHKKIAIVDWNGHALVFRRPTRDECHAYRVALESADAKADAAEQLCQRILVAFDADTNPTSSRVSFTTGLLVEFPMLASTPKIKIALGALMGLVEEEDLADLGKGVSVRPSPPKPTLEASPNGSPTAAVGPS